jgi:hypothetical protein
MAFPKAVRFGKLKTTHPEYRADYWRRCRVLYEGGPALLEDRDVLRKILPKHRQEEDSIYDERINRAFYIPYAGSILDKLVSELSNKPLTVTLPSGADAFYDEFSADVSKPGGQTLTVNQLAREQVLTALQCGRAWTLIDLPPKPEQPYANLEEQEKAGALRAYACAIPPERVIDWECDDAGALTFVIIEEVVNKRDGINDDRDTVIKRFRYYTREEWAVYELKYSKKQKPTGPSDEEEAQLVAFGPHSFGKVPIVLLKLPPGLWAMAKLEAMARAHFNQRNALSWGQLKTLFPMPVLKAAPPDPLDPISEDENRAKQRTGPGYIWVISKEDELEYFSPDAAPFQVAAADLDRIRDEMYRVLHSMALSIDNSGAALQRSADSKAVDQAAAAVILRTLGGLCREHVKYVYDTVAAGRGDELSEPVDVTGMDNFEDVTLSQLVIDAQAIATIGIPSATFEKLWKFKIAKLSLGPDASEDDLEIIKDELEDAITQDQLLRPDQPVPEPEEKPEEKPEPKIE